MPIQLKKHFCTNYLKSDNGIETLPLALALAFVYSIILSVVTARQKVKPVLGGTLKKPLKLR